MNSVFNRSRVPTSFGRRTLMTLALVLAPSCAAGSLTGAASLATGSQTSLDLSVATQMHPGGVAGLCLDVAGGKSENGTKVQVANCSANPAQKWSLVGSGDRIAVYGNKCLELAPGAGTGTQLQIWDCDAARPNQVFKASGSTWTNNGLCLDVLNDALTDGNPVTLWPCNKQNNQSWSGLTADGEATATAANTTTSVSTSSPTSGPYTNLVWSDEFNGAGAIDGSKWNFEVTCAPQNNETECYTNSTQNVTQDGQGNLVINAIRQGGLANGKAFSSGRITTQLKGDFTYGRIEARLQVPNGQGVWPAFWMMPSDSSYGAWPTSGELDIMEILGNKTSTLYGTAHYGLPAPYTQQQGTAQSTDFSAGFHVFALERDATQIRWYVDNQLYYTMNDNQTAFWPNNATTGVDGTKWPFSKRFYIILNLAMGGDWPGAVDGSIAQKSMLVDYVRVYQ